MPISLSLKPAIVEFQIKPGSSFTQAYQVTNLGSHPEIITPSVHPWINSSTSTPQYISDQIYPGFTFSLANADVKLDSAFRLEPSQSRQLVLKVSASPFLAPSDGYFTLFLSTESYQSNSNTSPVSARIGSHLLLSTNTETISPVPPQITSFKVTSSFIDAFFTPINFVGTATNNTPHFTKVQGNIHIVKSGKTISALKLAPDNVLAKSTRPLHCLDTHYAPVPCQLTPPFWPGLYQVKVQNITQNFYVWPLSPLILLTLILTTIVVITKVLVIFRSGH
jgi:hypothetical protein